ncbi:DUF421 domain-containing protein [Chitinophaga rhizophila]|uniref:DUF421 domain-containing protein n=1 Tax=Chitinophaga rhizophila TaxID=2866212 RepID=A0ABS7GC69_9BACT|nr:DUF421 domain-containing protein [Chitinophaga rhizophila]MBW8684740.1 DUF421 domain-containing protein [Chitinophaga rhizophila]
MNWEDVFIKDLSWLFALEIVVRTFVMFTLVLLVLRLSGKKGVRQLSVFEVAIIIALGSAAGDPMFQEDISIVPAAIVMGTIVVFYRIITWLTAKNERFESALEGDPITIVHNGVFELDKVNKNLLAKDEFFAEMRQANIEHLGQVREALLETSGNVSFLFFEDDEVKPGLPIWPRLYSHKCDQVNVSGDFACCHCGYVEKLDPGKHQCTRCKGEEWVEAIKVTRKS